MSQLKPIALELKSSQCNATEIHKRLKAMLNRPVRHNLSATEVAEGKKLKLIAKDIKHGIV